LSVLQDPFWQAPLELHEEPSFFAGQLSHVLSPHFAVLQTVLPVSLADIAHAPPSHDLQPATAGKTKAVTIAKVDNLNIFFILHPPNYSLRYMQISCLMRLCGIRG